MVVNQCLLLILQPNILYEEIKVKMEKITINVNGMMCMHCHARVEKVLKSLPGVTNVVVSLENKNATVEGEGITKDLLIQAVIDAGYEAF